MIPEFRYIRPATLEEALEILADEGTPVAGGTDLIIDLKEGKKNPGLIVDISSLEELRFIDVSEGLIRLGPLLTHSEIIGSDILRSKAASLVLACTQVGSPQIRNIGTLGGNICNASPAADTPPALALAEAEFVLQRKDSVRVVPFSEFFIGPNKTVLQKGELLVEIRFKGLDGWRGGFWKIGRRKAFVQARVNLAIACLMEGDILKQVRIAVGSCVPFAVRLKEAERVLEGKELQDNFLKEAICLAREKVEKISGNRPSLAYKLPAIEGLLWRSLMEIVHG